MTEAYSRRPDASFLDTIDLSRENVEALLARCRTDEERADVVGLVEMALPLSSPARFAKKVDETYLSPPHIKILDRKLEDLVTGRLGKSKLLVTMPPRHGKSELCSKYVPAWYLARYPDRRVILASYEAEFAADWGRKARDVLEQSTSWTGIKIRSDSKAAHRWNIEARKGGMQTAGVRGPITGKGAHLFIIDDPVKNSDDAMSETLRRKAWDWYISTAKTRLEPGAVQLLIMCMTGDTPVLMGDGVEKPLRDVRPGDTIATYENGGVTTSTVRNWANQGPDIIYEIRMKSGAVVRANARHPFLTVNGGVETWQRTDSLTKGNLIQRVIGVSGGGSSALGRAATSQPGVRACATLTTKSRGGRAGIVHHRSTRNPAAPLASDTATRSTHPTTTECLQSKPACVPSVSNRRPREIHAPTGTGSSASTTTTTPTAFVGCCATTATWPLATGRQWKPSEQRPTTYAIEPDEVLEVVLCGVEDVYDIQVDRTENFIANGLVSHNTRWHEDDLAGKLLATEGDEWEVVNFPALAEEEDILGRKVGDALWPGAYDEAALRAIRDAPETGYWWSALYQQRPTPEDGGFFRRATFKHWSFDRSGKLYMLDGLPVPVKDTMRFQTVDLAASTKTRADFTVVSTWAVTKTDPANLLLLGRFRGRVEAPEHLSLIEGEHDRWSARKDEPQVRFTGVEKQTYGMQVLQEAARRGFHWLRPLEADRDKFSRAIPAAQLADAGRIWFPQDAAWLEEWESELLVFPNGAHDDQVDTLAYAALEIGRRRSWAPRVKEREPDSMQERIWDSIQKQRKRKGVHPVLGRW